ncbi:LapA family protein [Tenggerimyces flavus]|uniref:Lipopolysaccharide assembly protein LapA domain-containing protein n=1 Tax=Tenggerimyces flavus TaxID=1708749 RepID=A0ABV7Y7M8_9ACTN|nr:LapA family protein [Tenggerimyces flavus]MBM7785914.1 putative integral membrane protein [Tenggerimyces flavus]
MDQRPRQPSSEEPPATKDVPETSAPVAVPVEPASAEVEAPKHAAPSPEAPRPGAKETLRSRTGGLWVVLIAATVVLILLLVFVLQNQQKVQISFLAAEGSLPLGVALLFAAIAGVLIVAIPGTGRILQLRRRARRKL